MRNERKRARTLRPLVWTALVGGALAMAPLEADAQARRGVQQRQQRVQPRQADRDAADSRQGQILFDRFAQRVGQALHLSEAQTRRLLRELQGSRSERTRINAQARAIRQELGQLIQEQPADEARIGALMDELFELEVARARVAVDEQRRLAEFLTPLQRARVIWLQQQLARQALQRGAARDVP